VEYESVLTRPEMLKTFGLSQREVGHVLETVASLVEPVRIYYLWRPILKDAKDDLVLETAVNGNASYIVTFNTRHFQSECQSFGIKTAVPAEIVRRP
jgi:predicted nucleic acid-binding protein